MSLILSGTDGLSDVDGSAATPAIRGTDANTGMFFPAADTIAFSEGGVEVMRLNSSGTLVTTNDASISGLTVGKGSGTTTQSTAIGNSALSGANTVGYNTALGYFALQLNTSGANNTAVGNQALNVNTSGVQNTGVGSFALFSNTTGGYNNALGQSAMYYNTTGSNNTAIGQSALQSNTTASNNTAIGYQSLYSNTTGAQNTAVGYQAGYSNTVSTSNTFIGFYAGYTSQSGSASGNGGNLCVGAYSGYSLTTGKGNTFVGGFTTSGAAASGYFVTTGSANTILGGYNGNQGGLDIRTASNYIVLSDGDGNPRGYFDPTGYFYCLQSYTGTTAAAANVNITSAGAFVRSTSALKYKQDIRDLESIDINKFRPVRYKSKCENDDQTKDHFGIVADEVDQAGIKELVNYGAEGEIEGFQYERLTVVLLKTIQDLQKRIEILENK